MPGMDDSARHRRQCGPDMRASEFEETLKALPPRMQARLSLPEGRRMPDSPASSSGAESPWGDRSTTGSSTSIPESGSRGSAKHQRRGSRRRSWATPEQSSELSCPPGLAVTPPSNARGLCNPPSPPYSADVDRSFRRQPQPPRRAYDRPRSAASTPGASPHRGFNHHHALHTSPPDFKRPAAAPLPVKRQPAERSDHFHHHQQQQQLRGSYSSAQLRPEQATGGTSRSSKPHLVIGTQPRHEAASEIGGGSERPPADQAAGSGSGMEQLATRKAPEHGRSDSAQSLAAEGFAARQDGERHCLLPASMSLSSASRSAEAGHGLNPNERKGLQVSGECKERIGSPRLEIHASAAAAQQLQPALSKDIHCSSPSSSRSDSATKDGQHGSAADAPDVPEHVVIRGPVGRTSSGLSTVEVELLQAEKERAAEEAAQNAMLAQMLMAEKARIGAEKADLEREVERLRLQMECMLYQQQTAEAEYIVDELGDDRQQFPDQAFVL